MYYARAQYTFSRTNNGRINAFSLYHQLWHRLSGLIVLFIVITFYKLRGLSTSEKRCGFNSSYARSLLNFTTTLL